MNASRYYSERDCDLAEFARSIDRITRSSDVAFAARVEKNIPVYEANALAGTLVTSHSCRRLMAEWAGVLADGAGALVVRQALPDHHVIDDVSAVFNRIIADERGAGRTGSDHFAAAGANDRIWNSLQKLCMADPELFALYHGIPIVDAICRAWLGPGYQMTAQVNLVRPGGAAQQAHRDYHLGFQTAEAAVRFPAHVHCLSPYLTLQGAIAHCDMPIESGPTRLLPFSQTYGPGYLAYRRDDFRHFFDQHFVQLELSKGDALFFNPALFHAAGDNRSPDIQRLANLLQISSPMGRAMENIDRLQMCKRVYPALRGFRASGRLDQASINAVIAATADGYPFPTNLETDPPKGGLAPPTQADLLFGALQEEVEETVAFERLATHASRRIA